jgi:hypothetical protein
MGIFYKLRVFGHLRKFGLMSYQISKKDVLFLPWHLGGLDNGQQFFLIHQPFLFYYNQLWQLQWQLPIIL